MILGEKDRYIYCVCIGTTTLWMKEGRSKGYENVDTAAVVCMYVMANG